MVSNSDETFLYIVWETGNAYAGRCEPSYWVLAPLPNEVMLGPPQGPKARVDGLVPSQQDEDTR